MEQKNNNGQQMKILVLYEELAWYFVNCLNEVAGNFKAQILVICKRPNNTAPFSFNYVHPDIRILVREDLNEAQLTEEVEAFRASGIFVGGWSHKPYLRLIKKMAPRTCAIGFDNQWTGSLKQRLGSWYFRLFIKPYMNCAFVPGKEQALFASHLGFTGERITSGAYCCDHKLFSAYHEKYRGPKEVSFPRRFLFTGRYAAEKGVQDLWQAFIEWQQKDPNEWELWCLGKGELEPPAHPKIKHFGFVQAAEMDEIIKNTGVFVLPSTFEPWGVVVHEYASAGYPLLCSDRTGAAGTFLEEGRNGFLFEAGNKAQLTEKMNKFSTLNQKELMAMAEHSVKMAAKITPAMWAERFIKMFEANG